MFYTLCVSSHDTLKGPNALSCIENQSSRVNLSDAAACEKVPQSAQGHSRGTLIEMRHEVKKRTGHTTHKLLVCLP